MLFWIVAALLTVGACLSVLVPFARGGPGRPDGAAHDIAVYRDQLDEVERDLQRGLIAPAEAEHARAEIGRRILKVHAHKRADGRQGRGGRVIAMAAVLSVPLVSWGVYAATGSPDMPSQPLAARLAVDPEEGSAATLIAQAEAHLRANPEDGRGWDVLAPIYLRSGRLNDSITAYRNAIRILGADARREAGLGEALAAAGGGVISTDAEAAFVRALALDPQDGKARFFVGLARAQNGQMDEAQAGWTAMLQDLPAQSPWRQAAQAALAQNRPQNGPDAQAVAAARDMSPADRNAMIRGMVESLDAKLRDNPGDKEGWQRLVRSHAVLGQGAEASDALARGLAALGNTTREAAELQAFGQSLGVTAERQP